MAPVWGFNSLTPFSLILGLVPAQFLNAAVFMVTLLRHSLASLTFYLFLSKRYQIDSNKLLGILIASIYGLNGFLITNQINPNFLDNIVLLPLLMIGLEKILSGQKSKSYSFILAIMIIWQFYTAYMACFFVIIYAIYFVIREGFSFKLAFRRLLNAAGYSIIGLCLSAIWLLPVFFSLLGTKAASGGGDVPWTFNFVHSPLEIIYKFIPGSSNGEEWGNHLSGPNFYVGLISAIGLIGFLVSSSFSKRHKIAASLVLATFLLLFSNTGLIRLMHMGQMPVGFYHRNAWIISFFLLIITFHYLKSLEKIIPIHLLFIHLGILVIGWIGLNVQKTRNYPLVTQNQLFIMLFLLVAFNAIILLNIPRSKKLLFLLLVCLLDLGYHAKTVIDRNLWHDSALSFSDEKDFEMLYKELPGFQTSLDRLEKSTGKTWNDPLTYNFYGINHFTSSVEYRNLEFLGRLGLASSTAMSVYSGGTPLSDALVNLRYYTSTETWSYSSRKQMLKSFDLIKDTDKIDIYENPHTLGLGFSGSSSGKDLELASNDPITNQNRIFQTLFETDQNILEPSYGFSVEMENMKPVTPDSSIFQRNNTEQEGKITIKFTPTDNNSFYFYAPKITSYNPRMLSFKLNDEPYHYFYRYRHPQIWNLANQLEGQQQVFTIHITEDQQLDLSGLMIYRFDNQLFEKFLSEATIAKWRPTSVSATQLSGSVVQPKGKEYLYTSIPYNKGWQVTVDGKHVKTEKVWDAMIAFKLSPGNHKLELRFIPEGFRMGAVFSTLSFLYMIVDSKWLSKQNHLLKNLKSKLSPNKKS